MLELLTLGACRQVGKSCFILKTLEGLIMLDCGIFPSYDDPQRYPNFGLVFSSGPLRAVFITHCHADHIGALPILTERWNYRGPIYMSAPTKELAYFILEDCLGAWSDQDRGVVRDDEEEAHSYTPCQVKSCLSKVQLIEPGMVITIGKSVQVHSLIAGHVLGACMFFVSTVNCRLLYTGDFSGCTFHLMPAQIGAMPGTPDVILCEATYATSLKDTRLNKQAEFFQSIVDCLLDGGKVLIPVFAVGRAQELLWLLEMYWKRFQLRFPIFFSAKNAERVLHVYTKYAEDGWTTKECRELEWNAIRVVDPEVLCSWVTQSDVPLVALTTPGTLARGLSLQIFQWIAPEEKNLLIIPHFCLSGTMEQRMLEKKNGEESIPIRCKTMNLHFGFHWDTRDLLLFFSFWKPSCVVLVHGEGQKMDYLARVIKDELGIQDCWVPQEEQWLTCNYPTK